MGVQKLARRIVIGVAGGAIVAVGGLLMVLPGPGLIVVLIGIIVLSKEFEWAQRLYRPVRDRAIQAAQLSVSTPLRIAWSGVAGLALVGAGIAWIVVESLPFSGVSTGSSLILSGVLLLALLCYSYWRLAHPEAVSHR